MNIYYFLTINTLASLIIAFLLWRSLPKKLQQPRWPIIFLFFFFGTFIPILGAIFLILIGEFLKRLDRVQKEIPIEILESPIFTKEKIKKPTLYAESGATIRIRSENTLTAERVQSMAAINITNTPLANLINRGALQDNNDELRLFAFSLLNKQAKKIDEAINETKQQLGKHNSTINNAKIEKRLAVLYWELIFFNLVQNDLLAYTTEKALEYALSAVKHLSEDQGLWVLLGKIYLRKNDKPEALNALNKAMHLRAPYEKILPYLAEISFDQHNFAEVRKYFNMSKYLSDVSKLKPVIEFWQGNK